MSIRLTLVSPHAIANIEVLTKNPYKSAQTQIWVLSKYCIVNYALGLAAINAFIRPRLCKK